jgi:hypothetical protein
LGTLGTSICGTRATAATETLHKWGFTFAFDLPADVRLNQQLLFGDFGTLFPIVIDKQSHGIHPHELANHQAYLWGGFGILLRQHLDVSALPLQVAEMREH